MFSGEDILTISAAEAARPEEDPSPTEVDVVVGIAAPLSPLPGICGGGGD